jgi:hypothetical protein
LAHVASPARLLRQELAGRREWLHRNPVGVRCAGEVHQLAFDAFAPDAVDHDDAAEAALLALGGTPPLCLQIVSAVERSTPAVLWSALRGAGPADTDVLAALPVPHRRILLARALHDEFADASAPVRDSVAQLGLALLADTPPSLDTLEVKFRMTRELPHWDPGPGPWSDKELVLLARCMRAGRGDPRPHLTYLPADPLARQAVAKYLVALLDPARVLTPADLRAALSTTFRNVRAVTSLLLAEGHLEASGGGHRVRSTPAPSGRVRRPHRSSGAPRTRGRG